MLPYCTQIHRCRTLQANGYWMTIYVCNAKGSQRPIANNDSSRSMIWNLQKIGPWSSLSFGSSSSSEPCWTVRVTSNKYSTSSPIMNRQPYHLIISVPLPLLAACLLLLPIQNLQKIRANWNSWMTLQETYKGKVTASLQQEDLDCSSSSLTQ